MEPAMRYVKIGEGGTPSRHQRACNHDGLDRARPCGRRQDAVRRNTWGRAAGSTQSLRGATIKQVALRVRPINKS